MKKLIPTVALCVLNSASLVATQANAEQYGDSGWTVVASYPIPEGASGLAWDGTSLYCGIYGVNGGRIYSINPSTGIATPAFVGDHEDAFGLTFDGAYLWTTDHPGSSSTPATALKLDWNGNIIDQFDMPDHYMSGIAYNKGEFWISRYYPDPGHLYRVNSSGGIIDQFDGPDDQPWDLAIQDGNIWIADYYGNTLYCINPKTGKVIMSNPSEGEDPSGVVWDGEYLWYCDNGDNWDEDILYKVDLQGSGSPEILIPNDEHAFNNVALGDAHVWNVDISNTGTASLLVTDVVFPPNVDLTCLETFPVVVAPNVSTQLAIEYAPTTFESLDVVATVVSNDPIHPEEPLTISGHGVYPEQTIHIEQTTHDFGQVRLNAHTRWFIDITNQGAESLIINNVTVDDSNFYVDTSTVFPITIETLDSTQIGIWFTPTVPVDVESSNVLVYTNDFDMNPAQLLLTGSGLDVEYPIGSHVWSSEFTDDWDNSFKAIASISDVNGDGVYDVIACSEDNFIRCFNGNADQNGDVLWEHEIYSGNIYSSKGLDVVNDVDGDGHRDVVVGATGGARLIRMLSGKTGDEIWTYHTNVVGNGGWVYQVDGSTDFNGDGINDVLACAGDDGEDAGPNRAYCFNGLNGELIWQHVVGGPVFTIIAVEDFNDDGVPDAVAGASDQWEINGFAVGIDGATGQAQWTFPVEASSVWALAQIGDVTLDGIHDVMIGDFYGDYYIVDGANGSQECGGGGLGLLIGLQHVGDLNGDGHPDLIAEQFNNFVRLISGNDCSTIWSTPVIDSPTVLAQANDLNNDGINDIVVGTLFSDNYAYFLSGADGEILHTQNLGSPVDAITSIPDVVGDGSWELVAGGRDGTIACLSGGIDAVVYNPADINEDGIVGITDLLIVIDQWGQTNSIADINNDFTVDVSDLLMIIDAWGA